MIGPKFLSTTFPVCLALAGTVVAQSHDTYVCASLDVDYILSSNQNPQNGLFRKGSDGLWTHLGINDPYSSALSFDPRDPDIIYTATLTGALRTIDGGTTWKVLTDWQMPQPKDICVDPNEPDTIYLALREGIAISRNQGVSWTWSEGGLPERGRYTQTIQVDRTSAGRVLAGCEIGIYLTEDGAQNWTRVLVTEDTVNDIQQSPHDADTWMAVTQSAGAWMSRDGGATWSKQVGVPTAATLYNVTFDPTDAMHVAIGSWTYGVYTTEDGGLTWRTRNRGLPQGHHVWRVGVHPDTGWLYASVVQSDLYVSVDFGLTWERERGGLEGSQISDFAFIPND